MGVAGGGAAAVRVHFIFAMALSRRWDGRGGFRLDGAIRVPLTERADISWIPILIVSNSMSSNSIPVTVMAVMRAQPGKEAELRSLLMSLVAPTRTEVGCLNYDLHQAAEDPARFMFHENWVSKADLDRHLASPHVTAVLSALGPLVAEAPQMSLWAGIA